MVRSQPGEIVRETLSQNYPSQKGLAEWLKVKALSSSPSTEEKKERERDRDSREGVREREREKEPKHTQSSKMEPEPFISHSQKKHSYHFYHFLFGHKVNAGTMWGRTMQNVATRRQGYLWAI
jgi:hypothetical protein